jgi:hypothetical protein
MHCWPRLTETLAEIHRVLKPGGLFFATTFFVNYSQLAQLQRRQQSGFFFFESAEEIGEFASKGGFSGTGGATVVRREGRACAIIKAMKSPLPASKEGNELLFDLFGKKEVQSTSVAPASTDLPASPTTTAVADTATTDSDKDTETDVSASIPDDDQDNSLSAPSTD